MKPILVVGLASLVSLVACTSSNHDCPLDDVLPSVEGGGEQNCGVLVPSDPDTAYQTAKDCVLAADAAGQPFVVRWSRDMQPGGQASEEAYVGADDGNGGLRRYSLHSPYEAGSDAVADHWVTYSATCTGLAARAMPCNAKDFDLCIDCVGYVEAGRCGD